MTAVTAERCHRHRAPPGVKGGGKSRGGLWENVTAATYMLGASCDSASPKLARNSQVKIRGVEFLPQLPVTCFTFLFIHNPHFEKRKKKSFILLPKKKKNPKIHNGNGATEANNEANDTDDNSEQDWILFWAETQRRINGRKPEGSDGEVWREIRDQERGGMRGVGGWGHRGLWEETRQAGEGAR